MAAAGDGLRRTAFVARLDRDDLGQVTGVVERVRTGQRERVGAVDQVSAVIAAMLARDEGEVAPERG